MEAEEEQRRMCEMKWWRALDSAAHQHVNLESSRNKGTENSISCKMLMGGALQLYGEKHPIVTTLKTKINCRRS